MSYDLYDMPTISVRISEEERKKLLKYGSFSSSVRDALRLYLDTKKSEELLRKLEELQRRNPITTTTMEEVRLIREDRAR